MPLVASFGIHYITAHPVMPFYDYIFLSKNKFVGYYDTASEAMVFMKKATFNTAAGLLTFWSGLFLSADRRMLEGEDKGVNIK